MSRLLLGVNVDHVATLRQARGTSYPDPLAAAREAVAGGADSITVHLREDRRHIQEHDVRTLRDRLPVPLNLELSLHPRGIALAEALCPAYACLVPERRRELTTEGGLDVAAQRDAVGEACRRLRQAGVRVSLFIDAEPAQVAAARAAGAAAVELHTGAYAESHAPEQRRRQLQQLTEAAQLAAGHGLLVHAGHGLCYDNVVAVAQLPHLSELNIGHSIVARAVFLGMREAVRRMRAAMLDAAR